MKKATLLFILFLGFFINAQIVSGTISSITEKQPIPYAKIGIENENAGTIADANGNFKIDLTNINKKTNLNIEVGGFEKYAISVEQFLKKNPQTIFLTEKVKEIEEVKINPAKFEKAIWGIKTKTKRIQIGHNPAKAEGDQSRELAMLFKTKRKAKIEKININISQFRADKPVFIRFTIYDKNFHPISTEDLHDEITPEKIIDGTYSFDVSTNNIWVKDDFYIGIQLLSNFIGYLYMSGSLMGNKTIYRKYSEEWKKIPAVSPAVNIEVKVLKS